VLLLNSITNIEAVQ